MNRKYLILLVVSLPLTISLLAFLSLQLWPQENRPEEPLPPIPKEALYLPRIDSRGLRYPSQSTAIDGLIPPQEWPGAYYMHTTFVLPNGSGFPADIYLGHDGEDFYIGAIIYKPGPNPRSNITWWVGDILRIYFDVNADGVLMTPEDGKESTVFIEITANGSPKDSGLPVVSDVYWAYNSGPVNIWTSDKGGVDIEAGTSDYLEGDLTYSMAFPLDSPDLISDGMHLKPGKVYLLSFCIEWWRSVYVGWDDWPGDGHTPYVCDTNDNTMSASGYAPMVIDLRYPMVKQYWIPVFVFPLIWPARFRRGPSNGT